MDQLILHFDELEGLLWIFDEAWRELCLALWRALYHPWKIVVYCAGVLVYSEGGERNVAWRINRGAEFIEMSTVDVPASFGAWYPRREVGLK